MTAAPPGSQDSAVDAPDGEYLRVQVKGYQEYEGFVTTVMFCGAPHVIVRDAAGGLIAMFPPASAHCYTPPLGPPRPGDDGPLPIEPPYAGEGPFS